MKPRALYLVLVAAVAPAAPLGAEEPGSGGFSLDDEWNEWWRRIADRSGRPDPDGPVQQRFSDELYREYELDLAVPAFPLRLERRWSEQAAGARLWVQSLDELELATRAQLKVSAPLSTGWKVGLAFDRLQTRTARSDLLRIDFVHDRPGDGPHVSLSFYPRWEKVDSDAAVAVGYRRAGWGDARVRLFALDPFTNASFALTEARETEPPVSAKQLDLPIAAAAELASEEVGGVRAELYAGGILPHTTRYRFADPGTAGYRQELSGLVAGALVEWQPAAAPALRLGATGLSIATRWRREHRERPELDRLADETTHQARVYAIAAPDARLRIEAQARFTARPETDAPPDEDGESRDDGEWLWSARGEWMFSRAAGIDLGFLRVDRDSSGPPDVRVDGTRHRLLTRALLRLGRLWASFGVSWDLDPGGKGPFGGGGATLIVDL